MLGRSDGTLNPAGVRFGSADLYNLLTFHFADRISDSLAVGVRRKGWQDEKVFLFIQLAKPLEQIEDLIGEIKKEIREALSPRHVPAMIAVCPAIPYTLNGKKVEVAVKKILSCSVDSLCTLSLANPESLQFFHDFAKTF